MSAGTEKSSTPMLDTYTQIAEAHPEWPNIRRFIIPENELIIWNLDALNAKIDMLIYNRQE